MTKGVRWGPFMIAVDTNILAYAHRPDMPAHSRCRSAIEHLVRSGSRFALPWPCLHEFIGVVTNPRIFARPTSTDDAAAICLGHGVSELWTADRDFSYFPRLKTRNPVAT